MRSRDQTHSWSRVLLAALVLAANVGAPFRSANSGRSLLSCEPPHAAKAQVVRVRALSTSALTQGHRVAVGLARGGTDRLRDFPPVSQWALLPALPRPHLHAGPAADRPPVRSSHPLRC